MRWKIRVATLLVLSAAVPASGQSVQQSGQITVNQAARWVSNGVIGTGGTAADGLITALGITNANLSSFCISSARASAAGRNQLCFGAQTSGAAVISLQNYGTATAQDLIFRLNGVDLTLPSGGGAFLTATGTLTVGHAMCVNTAGGVLQDCGVGISAGTQWGVPYFSAAGTMSSTAAMTNGQMVVGQTGAAPTPRTLSGDVGSVSSAGAVTLQSVNGVTFPSSFQANGILYASSSSVVTSLLTNNVGYCLLSQGTSSAPIFASCASGAGSAGGSNTQVQFNNSTSLGGSVNLTWVSPALTVGVASTTSGQVAFASSGGGTVTMQAPAGVTNTYNFNLPNGAGTSGQPLLSGGGGSTVTSFGTLGTGAGGTNCTSPSGTCLDNITGFSSTGYVQRTGSGTYAFSTTIPVSGGGTGLASGTSGGVLGYTASGTLASSVALTQYALVAGGGAGATPVPVTKGTAGQILIDQTGANPAWTTMGTDATINSAGALTIANSAVTLAKMANAAAYSLYGNFTGSSAAPQVSTIGALTQKASPAAGDLIMIQDQAAAGQLKYATVSSVSAAGSVSSIASNTGAFTLSGGITNATNDLRTQRTVNAQTGTSYAIADSDRGAQITGTNASAQAYSIAQPGGSFVAGWYTNLYNKSTNVAGVITITPTSATINGAATLAVQPGQSVQIVSDGTNYQASFLGSAAQLPGTTTNDAANSGNIGEYWSVSAALNSYSLTNATPSDVLSTSIPAGDWDVGGVIYFLAGASTTVSGLQGSFGSASATINPTPGQFCAFSYNSFVLGNTTYTACVLPPTRLSLSGATTYYLVARGDFAVSTLTAGAIFYGRRAR